MEEKYNLTLVQSRMLTAGTTEDQVCSGDAYIWGNVKINEKVNFDKLKEAVNYFVKKNDSMRTEFCYENNKIYQYFPKYESFDIEVVDVKSEEDVEKLEKEIINTPFNMLNNPLLFVKLYRCPDGTGGIVTKMHHAITDGYSMILAAYEILGNYNGLLSHYVTYSFKDYIKASEKYPTSKRYDQDKQFWNDMFKDGLPEVTYIPSKLPKKDEYSFDSAQVELNIDKETVDAIHKYCKKHRLTVCNFLMSAYSVYINKVTNLSEFMLNTFSQNRKNFKEKLSTGIYAAECFYKVKVEDVEFKKLVENIGSSMQTGYKHREFLNRYWPEYISGIDPNRDIITRIMTSYQKVAIDMGEKKLNYEVRGANNTSTYGGDIMLHIFDFGHNKNMRIVYDYLTDKFTEDDIKHINNEIVNIAKQVVASEDITVSDITVA